MQIHVEPIPARVNGILAHSPVSITLYLPPPSGLISPSSVGLGGFGSNIFSAFFQKLARCHAAEVAEDSVEVGWLGEAAGPGDFGDVQIGFGEEAPGVIDSFSVDNFDDSLAGFSVEAAGKMVGGAAEVVRQPGDGEVHFGEVDVEVFLAARDQVVLRRRGNR